MKVALALMAAAFGIVAHAQERYVDKEVRVKAPVDAVWQAWTTTEGIKTFFAPDANVEARVDGPFEIYINPLAPPGQKGADGMRFLAVQDRKMITFTWFTYNSSASMTDQWKAAKVSEWNSIHCGSQLWREAIDHGWAIVLDVGTADGGRATFNAQCK